ncbi:MAG: hypothetical protein IBJ12_15770 [Sphingomonadaceae bacterium]|nr:hypothetical protein [Sphingomonadaceae bacterium]
MSVEKLLAFLAGDMATRPDTAQPLSPDLAARIAALTVDAPDDLSGTIEGDVAL